VSLDFANATLDACGFARANEISDMITGKKYAINMTPCVSSAQTTALLSALVGWCTGVVAAFQRRPFPTSRGSAADRSSNSIVEWGMGAVQRAYKSRLGQMDE
jgi:hypothetical protein